VVRLGTTLFSGRNKETLYVLYGRMETVRPVLCGTGLWFGIRLRTPVVFSYLREKTNSKYNIAKIDAFIIHKTYIHTVLVNRNASLRVNTSCG